MANPNAKEWWAIRIQLFDNHHYGKSFIYELRDTEQTLKQACPTLSYTKSATSP